MNLQSLMGPGAWEHYRPDPYSVEGDEFFATHCADCLKPNEECRCIVETVRQAMKDWDGATDEQRADALAKAAALAAKED